MSKGYSMQIFKQRLFPQSHIVREDRTKKIDGEILSLYYLSIYIYIHIAKASKVFTQIFYLVHWFDPPMLLKGGSQSIPYESRTNSPPVGVPTRGSGSQLVNAACFLVPDDDAGGNTVTHGLFWFRPRGRKSSKGGVRGHCIILHPECLQQGVQARREREGSSQVSARRRRVG